MKDAYETTSLLGDTEKIELYDNMTDIQYRTFKKVGGITSGGGAVDTPTENALAVAIAVADAIHVDPGHGAATPQCRASVRGDDDSIAQISGFMGIRVGSQAGQVGKRMKALYSARYGAFAAASIPNRTTRYNGKSFSENVYDSRGSSDLNFRAVAQCTRATRASTEPLFFI